MATTEFIAAIELGSSKITGVAGKKNSDRSQALRRLVQVEDHPFTDKRRRVFLGIR